MLGGAMRRSDRERLRSRKSRRRRQLSAAFATTVLAGALLALLISSQSVSGQPVHAADLETLFHDFVKLDRKLTRAIDRAEKGESVHGLIDQIERGKLAIVDDQFQSPVDGVKGSEWFSDLDCVDAQLLV